MLKITVLANGGLHMWKRLPYNDSETEEIPISYLMSDHVTEAMLVEIKATAHHSASPIRRSNAS